jgi:hypothetical protein
MCNQLLNQLIKNRELLLFPDYRCGSLGDISGYGNNPAGYDSVFWDGSGLGFDGTNSYLAIVDSAAVPAEFQDLGNSNDYAVFALANIRNGSSAGAGWWPNSTLMELRRETATTGDQRTPFSFGIESGMLTCGRRDSTGTSERQMGTITVNDGIQHYLAFSMNSDTVDFFVDGLLDVSRTYSSVTGDLSVGSFDPSNLFIGARTDNTGIDLNPLLGYLDLIGVVNRKLTATEHATLYGDLLEMYP